MANCLAVNHHCERGAVSWHHGGLRSQCPAEVDIVRAGNASALRRSIDAAERLRCESVRDGDRLDSKVYLVAGLIMGDRVDLVRAVPGCAGTASVGEEVGKHL